MADDSVSMPCGRRDFTPRPVLSASVGSDSDRDRLSSVVKDCGKKLSGLEPFVDADEAKRLAKEAERMQFLRQMARKKKQNDQQRMLQDTVLDFDPKQGGEYYTRFIFADLTKFDLDEECKSISVGSILIRSIPLLCPTLLLTRSEYFYVKLCFQIFFVCLSLSEFLSLEFEIAIVLHRLYTILNY